ncbi:DNA-binding WRKY [Cynara cardunculus var. scolymus]|uniref:DNA-binding WRKY n=1 Tax=Cynara cardunculus var. scolymus TaxID=59895 RepID=A0A118JYB9_CYNCS|nr:DNA-binding WRKY [Cynara cardunculus var. scolymus]
MDEKRRLISSSAPYLRPTISIPSSSTVENLFTGGGGRPGESPGPMTLISNFFSNNDVESDCRSFSQLLAGTMSSPAQIPGRILSRDSDAGADASGGGAAVDFQFSNAGRASGLVVTQASTFTIPPGLSPATLLDSPGFFLPAQSPEFSSSGGHSHSHSQPPSVAADKPSEDGYNWRKYGQKQVKGSEYPRSYYKCTNQNCRVKKKVERNLDGLVTEIIYNGQHNHQPPRSEYAGVGTSGEPESFKGQTGNFNHSRVDAMSMKGDQRSGSSDGKEASDDVTMPQAKRRNVEVKAVDPVSSHRTVTEPRIVVQATSEIDLLDDGYKWRKYGQKVVKGNRHPRHCTSQGCKVRKHVERAASDPMAVITTYEGKHNHLVPVVRNNNHDTTKETASQLRPHGPIGHLRLKDEQIM